jgi:hypothetical protein
MKGFSIGFYVILFVVAIAKQTGFAKIKTDNIFFFEKIEKSAN